MTNSVSTFDIGLSIHLLSFSLPKNVIKKLDEIRVSITTLPDGVKQHYHLQGKKMNCTNHVFSLNITNKTKRIVMVFRKRNLFTDGPMIASKTIHLSEFGKFQDHPITAGSINSDVKSLNLYYPLQKQMKEEQTYNRNIQRKSLGSMEIQLTFTAPYSNFKRDKTIKDNNKSEKKSKSSKIKNQSIIDGEYQKVND